MVRRFVTLDGEVLAEENWDITQNPKYLCFWCDDHLLGSENYPCYNSFDGSHDWVTICKREFV